MDDELISEDPATLEAQSCMDKAMAEKIEALKSGCESPSPLKSKKYLRNMASNGNYNKSNRQTIMAILRVLARILIGDVEDLQHRYQHDLTITVSGMTILLLMDKILHDPKVPKLWELWYIPYNG